MMTVGLQRSRSRPLFLTLCLHTINTAVTYIRKKEEIEQVPGKKLKVIA